MSARLRAAVVAAATGMLALATALVAAPAYAATTNGAPVETQTQFCSPSLSARTDVAAITTGVQAQVDQDFHLVVTVAGLNQCLPSQSASVNLQLPAGVAVSSSGQSACVTFASTNPAGTTQTVPCVRSDGGSGFLRVDPQGGNSWTLTRGGRNVVQVQLAVRASTAGQRTAFARVCDSGSTVRLHRLTRRERRAERGLHGRRGTRAAGVDHRGPAEDPEGGNGLRRRLLPGSGGHLDLPQGAGVPHRRAPAGVWRIQRRGPGTAPFTTIASKTLTAGGGYQSLTTTASGLEPGSTHRFRACFTPTGGVQVCGSEITLTTASA